MLPNLRLYVYWIEILPSSIIYLPILFFGLVTINQKFLLIKTEIENNNNNNNGRFMMVMKSEKQKKRKENHYHHYFIIKWLRITFHQSKEAKKKKWIIVHCSFIHSDSNLNHNCIWLPTHTQTPNVIEIIQLIMDSFQSFSKKKQQSQFNCVWWLYTIYIHHVFINWKKNWRLVIFVKYIHHIENKNFVTR